MRIRPFVSFLVSTLAAASAGDLPTARAQGTASAARVDSLPLETTRRLRFTTDEGTWMSLDVSPDGRTIIFDLLGDLYTMRVDGGKATRLTSGAAFDAQPRWSPDGRSIVYVTDRTGADNVWVADASGANPRQITRDERTMFISPEWTPDGEFIVVSKSTEIVNRPSAFQLTMYHRTGSGGLPLTGAQMATSAVSDSMAPRPRAVIGVAFGNDPRHAWVSMSNGGARGYGEPQIARLERSTGRLYRWTDEIAGAFRPVASPDGKWLVYGTRRDGMTGLKLVELATGDTRWLVNAVDRDNQEGSPTRDYLPGASFTPDSRALVASYHGKFWRVTVADGRATPIPFSADVDVGMGPLARFDYAAPDSMVTARRIEHPRRSPDGRALAFSALAKLWVQPLGGASAGASGAAASPRRLDDVNDAFFPAWSPDGRWIAYVTWDDAEGGDIYRVRADGAARPERLTRQKAFYERLAWTPNGERLVAARGPRQQRLEFFDELRTGRPQSRDLVWIPAAGGEATIITPVNTAVRWASQHYGIPHFTTDSTRVWFTDAIDGLVSVRWDGSDRQAHLRVNGWEWSRNPPALADEILVSPQGTRAVALVNNQVWLIDVPPTGQRLPTLMLPSANTTIPAKRLTTVGADFVEWSADGKSVHWALGNSWWTHDVASGTTAPQRQVTVRVRRDVPSGSIALRGARVVTMKGNEVIENADVVVTNDRIVAVGARGSVTIPAGARELDVAGKTILPGYVDIHSHMWAPWGVHRKQIWEYLANLAYGVTTTRDPQTMTPDVITYADAVEAGDILGPRVYSTARGIFASEDITSLEEARHVARRYAEHYRTQTIKNYLVGDRIQRQWLVMAAHEAQLTPTAEGTSDFKMNLTLALDGYAGVEHELSLTTIYADVARLFAESGITYTPTLIVTGAGLAGEHEWYRTVDVHGDSKLARFTPHEELDRRTLRRTTLAHPNQYAITDLAKSAKKILDAGGRVGLGAHGQLQGLGVHWELAMLHSGGLTNHEALRVATIYGAAAIGHGKNVGSIELGKFADLQILDRNPLEDLRNSTSIRWVMINGRLFETETMNQVLPEARPLVRQWWQNGRSSVGGT